MHYCLPTGHLRRYVRVLCGYVSRPGDEQQLRESLMDWNISFSDLQVNDCLKAGVRNNVFR